MLITKELAYSIEHCIKQSHADLASHYPESAQLEVGSGMAFFTGNTSFFSQVIGWGFNVKDNNFITQIQAIEDFYRSLNHYHVDIELSPLVGNEVVEALSRRGYIISELNNISVFELSLKKGIQASLNSDYEIREVTDSQLSSWAQCVALGFDCQEAWQQFYHYASSPHITAFGAYYKEQLVAGGTIAIHQQICDLGLTSTLPNHRGKGLQKALLSERLTFATTRDANIATVTTEPGSISDLNIQKMGFQIAYTRLKLTHLIEKLNS